MFYRYGFESEIYPTLSRIPVHVRMKLDVTGVKLSLKDWLAFSMEERTVLCHLPAESEEEGRVFSSYLDFLSRKYFERGIALVPPVSERPWEDPSRIPESVEKRSQETGQAVTLQEWLRLDPRRRYALFKVSISKNEPEQFFALLRELRESSRDRS